MTAAIDFAALPPEINSGMMYTGAGSAPMTAVTMALSDLAEELNSSAATCTAALDRLSAGAWQGPSAMTMIATASRYVAWMKTTAGTIGHAAACANAAVGAYHAAFAGVVPPPVIAANRAQLATLVATNLLGQNSVAIAATEAAYQAMWAQDVAAMSHYAVDSAAATAFNSPTAPPAVSNSTAPTNPAASADATSTALAQQAWNILSPANANTDVGLSGMINDISGQTNSALGDFFNSGLISDLFQGGLVNPETFISAFHALDYLIIYAAADMMRGITGGVGQSFGGLGVGGVIETTGSHTGGPAAGGAPAAQPIGSAAVNASVGKATLVRALSVPLNWADVAASGGTIPPMVTGSDLAAPVAGPSPVVTAGLPRSIPTNMVDTREDDKEETPGYGRKTKAVFRTPLGG